MIEIAEERVEKLNHGHEWDGNVLVAQSFFAWQGAELFKVLVQMRTAEDLKGVVM